MLLVELGYGYDEDGVFKVGKYYYKYYFFSYLSFILFIQYICFRILFSKIIFKNREVKYIFHYRKRSILSTEINIQHFLRLFFSDDVIDFAEKINK